MARDIEKDSTDQSATEEQLFELIKQAGNEARTRKKDTMARHYEKLREAVKKGVLQRKGPVST